MIASFLIIGTLAASSIAAAEDEREIDVPNAAGMRLFLAIADRSLTPSERVDAAKAVFSARFGAVVGASPTRTIESHGQQFSASFARFESDPGNVHTWVTGESNARLCHIVVPVRSRGAVLQPLLDRCFEELQHAAPSPSVVDAKAKDKGVDVATLAAALDSVPRSRRPLAMVLRNRMRFSGGFAAPSVEAWMLFANGYATGCYHWDPAMLDPTPEALGVAPLRCTVLHWRRMADGYQFEEKPGVFGPTERTTLLKAFTADERLSLDLETVSGNGTGPAAVGMTSVNSVSSGQVRMTADGNVTLGTSTSVVVSGPNIGGGMNAQHGPLHGRYYVNGYLIAIGSRDGTISRGFAGIDRTTKTYLYLNGTEYWPPDH